MERLNDEKHHCDSRCRDQSAILYFAKIVCLWLIGILTLEGKSASKGPVQFMPPTHAEENHRQAMREGVYGEAGRRQQQADDFREEQMNKYLFHQMQKRGIVIVPNADMVEDEKRHAQNPGLVQKPRQQWTQEEVWADEFKFEKNEDCQRALERFRGCLKRSGGLRGAGIVNGRDTKLLPMNPNPNSYENMNPAADLFAREYALRKFVNNNTKLFLDCTKRMSDQIGGDWIGATVRRKIRDLHQEGLKDAKKQLTKKNEGNFIFPKDLQKPYEL